VLLAPFPFYFLFSSSFSQHKKNTIEFSAPLVAGKQEATNGSVAEDPDAAALVRIGGERPAELTRGGTTVAENDEERWPFPAAGLGRTGGEERSHQELSSRSWRGLACHHLGPMMRPSVSRWVATSDVTGGMVQPAINIRISWEIMPLPA